jgi:hypothetical protein
MKIIKEFILKIVNFIELFIGFYKDLLISTVEDRIRVYTFIYFLKKTETFFSMLSLQQKIFVLHLINVHSENEFTKYIRVLETIIKIMRLMIIFSYLEIKSSNCSETLIQNNL